MMAPSVALLGGAFLVVVLTLIQHFVRIYQHQSRVMQKTGCKLPRKRYARDPFFSLDVLWECKKAAEESRLLALYSSFCENYGTTHSTKRLHIRGFMTIDPENIRTMLTTKMDDFDVGWRVKFGIGPLLGESGLITSNGLRWKHSRALANSLFRRSDVKSPNALEPHLRNLFGNIRDGETVDLRQLFSRFELDIATDWLLGESTYCLKNSSATETAHEFAEAFEAGMNRASLRVIIADLLWLNPFYKDKKLHKNCKIVHAYADVYVDRALKAHRLRKGGLELDASDTTFLDILVQDTNNKTDIRSQLLQILTGAHDTSTALLSNLWFILARRPEIVAKIRKDMEILEGNHPNAESVKKLLYLNQTIKEALRFFSVIPIGGRVANKDTSLPLGGGPDGKSPIFVKKGQEVAWCTYAMHRRVDIYGEDVNEFKPERFDNFRPGELGWGFSPFGGGPRVCVGQHKVLFETAYITVRFLQEFKGIEGRDSMPWREDLRSVVNSKGGVKVALHR